MSLKEATAEKHAAAEQTALMQSMIDGTITEEKYKSYLFQMSTLYIRLETLADNLGLLSEIPNIRRHALINADLAELMKKGDNLKLVPSLVKYCEHLATIEGKPFKIWAHIYVRHLGDLYGGQILKERVPGSGRWYTFKDPETLKYKIREFVGNGSDVIEEVNKAYDFNIAMFEEIQNGVVHDGGLTSSVPSNIGEEIPVRLA